jgi:HD superfamily phosphohydrolase
MEIDDVVYGPVRVDEPVLVAVINSAAMQRLQGVLQHGISGLVGVTRATTRFEHSLGVMILVRRLGGATAEQVAALLHDVSHTAFSHVIDYVFEGHDSQGYHDEKKAEYIAGTDLPALLARYGYDWRDFIEEERFPLLEQPAPALCADRLDYFLRDSRDLGLADEEQIAWILDHLVVYEGRIVVDDLEAGRWLAYTYIAADEASWANFREVGLYELTARAIKTGLASGAIDESDLWTNDAQAWAKLQSAPDPALQQQLSLISPATRFVWDEERPDFEISTKLRTIDPDLLLDGRLELLSRLDPAFGSFRDDYLATKQGKWPIRALAS